MPDALATEPAERAAQALLSPDGAHRAGGNAATERDAARQLSGPLIAPLVDLAVLRASGPEAADFLNNLLTNDIKTLPAGEVRLAGLCTPKGRLIALFDVVRDPVQPDDLLLLLPAEIAGPVLRKLSMYILRSKVKLADASAQWLPVGVGAGDAEALAAAIPRLKFAAGGVWRLGRVAPPALGLALVPAAQAGALTTGPDLVGLAAWRTLEIAAGRPRVVAATQEAFVPQMLNLELAAIGGVNFRKGCYPGQEIVARTQYLGKVKRRMYRGSLPAPARPGDPVFAPATGDQPCGALVSTAPAADGVELLVCVQSGAVEGGAVHVGALDGPAIQIGTLPYDLDGPDTRAG